MTAKKKSAKRRNRNQQPPAGEEPESKYDDLSLAKLKEEAEHRQLTITKADGTEGEPEKEDYILALKLHDSNNPQRGQFVGDVRQPYGDGHSHGNDLTNPQKDSFGIPQARGKRTDVARRLAPVETDEERDERIADEAERRVEVVAIRAGEYPVGVRREPGARFAYVVPEDADDREEDDEYELPSWMKSIDEEYETREVPAVAAGNVKR